MLGKVFHRVHDPQYRPDGGLRVIDLDIGFDPVQGPGPRV